MAISKRRRSTLALGSGLVLLFAALFAAPLTAGEYEDRRKEGRCLCHTGQSSYQYLRAPFPAPEDPPHCGLLRAGGNCADKPRPKGARAACWELSRRECFWKRHAGAWNITCSLCLADDTCPECDESLAHVTDARRAELKRQIALEKKLLGDDVVIARSPNFYVVTNAHKQIKMLTARGTKRLMSAHEIVHLYAQRGELAQEDFAHWFGGQLEVQNKPMAVYVVDKLRDFNKVGAKYFGRPGIHMNYAFNYGNRIAEGYCGNGFVVSQQRETNESRMHMYARHQIGHILFSVWHVSSGFEKDCPRWAWVGAAHFLAKLPSIFEKYATYCVGEVEGANGPQNKWPHRVKKMARKKMSPIETFFDLPELGSFKYGDHLRAWSMMDLGLREDRERWLKLLHMLRQAKSEGEAFKTALGVTPEQYDETWKQRVLGKRKSMGQERDDPKASDHEAGLSERERILQTKDSKLLSGRIRGLDVIKDLDTLRAIVPYLGHESDQVRETTHLLLCRTQDKRLWEWLRTKGTRVRIPLVRAEVYRVLGRMQIRAARGAFEGALSDRNWHVRANAAWALQQIGSTASQVQLLAAMDEKNEKSWIAIADALAAAQEQSREATEAFATRLNHRQWQVRLTAVRGLARRGTYEAITPLIERFEEESGRVRREIYTALKTITGDDLGLRASSWRAWWKEQQPRVAKGLPLVPPEVKSKPADDRYGEPKRGDEPPHYYGRRLFSKSIAYVLDVSDSMRLDMVVDESTAKQLGGIPRSGTRMHIAQQAIIDSLKRLDPRTDFDIIFFETRVSPWRQRLVKASRGNVNAATAAVLQRIPMNETNFYGALKAALGLHAKPTTDPRLDAMPDTVFFLTDGRPTKGEITAMPELASWFANLNRFAKVTLHVIALGELNVDLHELHRLVAAGDGGELIHVREAH